MAEFNEYGRICKMALRRPQDAFRNQAFVEQQWQQLNYHDQPDYVHAIAEYDSLIEIFLDKGVELEFLPPDERLSMDGIYVRDASLITPKGMIFCRMGKPERIVEPEIAHDYFKSQHVPIVGAINHPGSLEGGDLVWINGQTCAIGRGYRTNDDGIRQLKAFLGEQIRVETVPLPHYKGSEDVFHLMSVLSPLDKDLLLVYSPLIPVPFREYLLHLGNTLIEVPDEEFESMACNVLALAPRCCLMLEGNKETRRRLEKAGCEVITYAGMEISRKGEGGPTCLTRPLIRE